MSCCNDDCNQGRTCPQRQARAECHVPCSAPPQRQSFPFAPGVIDGAREYVSLGRMEALGRTLLVLACLGALVAVIGFAAGYINLGDLLP